jgi:O-antigen/teichoic acid export membrane protein
MIYKLRAALYRFLGKDVDAQSSKTLVKGSAQTFGIQALTSVLVLGTSILIARLSGAEGYGIYALVFTWVQLLGVIGAFGMDDLLIKEIPIMRSHDAEDQIEVTTHWVFRRSLWASIVVSILFGIFVYAGWVQMFRGYFWYFVPALFAIPLFTLLHLMQAALRGMELMRAGQMAEKVWKPLSFLTLLAIFYFFVDPVTDMHLIILNTFSFAFAVMAAIWAWLRFGLTKLPRSTNVAETLIDKAYWYNTGGYFLLMTLLQTLGQRSDVLMLGFLRPDDMEGLGYYNVAIRFSELTMIPFAIINTVAAPVFARLYAEGKRDELQIVFAKVTLAQFIMVLLGAIFFLSFGGLALSIYGKEFGQALPILLLLCGFQLMFAFFGPVGYMLMMTGQEKPAALALGSSVALTILLHYLFIQHMGIMGAAWATGIGMMVYQTMLAWITKRQLGLTVSILGLWKKSA